MLYSNTPPTPSLEGRRNILQINKGIIYLLTPFVIQSEAKNLGNILADVFVYVTEILPPFGRLNDKYK